LGTNGDLPGLLIALMMKAASTSETSVNFYHTARCNNPEDSHRQPIISFSGLNLRKSGYFILFRMYLGSDNSERKLSYSLSLVKSMCGFSMTHVIRYGRNKLTEETFYLSFVQSALID
jgi:hypothetical protein